MATLLGYSSSSCSFTYSSAALLLRCHCHPSEGVKINLNPSPAYVSQWNYFVLLFHDIHVEFITLLLLQVIIPTYHPASLTHRWGVRTGKTVVGTFLERQIKTNISFIAFKWNINTKYKQTRTTWGILVYPSNYHHPCLVGVTLILRMNVSLEKTMI